MTRRLAPLALLLASCSLLPWSEQKVAHVFQDVVKQDVYDITYVQLDRDYAIERAELGAGVIETAWDFGSVSESSRLQQREKVEVEIESVDDGVQLMLRVRRQVRERSGLLGADDQSEEGWSDTADDLRRAEILFAKIHASLVKGRPSEDFYRRPLDPTEAPQGP